MSFSVINAVQNVVALDSGQWIPLVPDSDCPWFWTVYAHSFCFSFYQTKEVHLSHDKTKPTKWVCAHRRLRSAWAFAQSDQSSLSAWRKLGSLAKLWAHSEDWSDSADDQADLSLRWAHTHYVGFDMLRLIFIYWNRMIHMDAGRINRRVFEWADRKSGTGCKIHNFSIKCQSIKYLFKFKFINNF